MGTEKEKLAVKWMQSTIEQEGVKSIIKQMTWDDEPDAYKIPPNGSGRCSVLCSLIKLVPHHSYLKVPKVLNKYHLVLVTIPGRIGYGTLWHNTCSARSEIRQEEMPTHCGNFSQNRLLPTQPKPAEQKKKQRNQQVQTKGKLTAKTRGGYPQSRHSWK